jgi:hypothetical protein
MLSVKIGFYIRDEQCVKNPRPENESLNTGIGFYYLPNLLWFVGSPCCWLNPQKQLEWMIC